MKKTVIVNTLALYFRQALVVLINLYVVRLILNELGVVDYGIYNVILGVTALFSFIPSAMTISVQRQFVFAMEQGKLEFKKTFTSSFYIYFFLLAFSGLILFTVGGGFVRHYLELPNSNYESVMPLYHCSIIIFLFSIASSLLISIIIAHENIKIFALLSTAEALLKLTSAFGLQFFNNDKLIVYGSLVAVSSLVVFILYNLACIKYYKKYRLNILLFDLHILKDMVKFSGWTLFGFFTSVLRTHGVTILVNQWFNPIAVASKVISNTVATQFMLFANNLNTSLYPPIVRDYSNGDLLSVKRTVLEGSKLSFFLVWVLTLPMIIETEYIMSLWLINPPEDAVLFTRLALIESLLIALGLVIGSGVRATGKVGKYEVILGIIQIVSFVIIFISLLNGYPAYSVFIVGILTNVVMMIFRVSIAEYLMKIKISVEFYKLLPMLMIMMLISTSSCLALTSSMEPSFLRLIFIVVLGTFLSSFMMYKMGITQELKLKIKYKIKQVITSR